MPHHTDHPIHRKTIDFDRDFEFDKVTPPSIYTPDNIELAIVERRLAHFQKNWITTYSGTRHYLAAPVVEDIQYRDIAQGCSLQPRFTGQCAFHWSIAAHQILMHDYISLHLGDTDQDLMLGILVHDAPEAYLSDISSPLKEILGPIYKRLEQINLEAIHERFHINLTDDDTRLIKDADCQILLAEAEVLLADGAQDWVMREFYDPADVSDLGIHIQEYMPSNIRDQYIERLTRYAL